MDPVTLIVQALIAGAAEATKDTASNAIKGAYQLLRDLLIKKFQKDDKGRVILEEYEKGPDVWKKPLEDLIEGSGVETDEKILAAARALLNLCNPVSQTSKYDIDVKGDNVQMVTGDEATVTMNFHEEKTRSRRKKKA